MIKPIKSKKSKSGLSILELAFSVAIIGLIIIFIIGMYSTFFTSGTKLNEENIANLIAQSYINRYQVYANSEDPNLRDILRQLVNQSQNQSQEMNQTTTFGLYTSQFVGRRSYIIQVMARNLYVGELADSILVRVGVYWYNQRSQQIGSRRGIIGYGRTGLVLQKVLNVPK